MEPATRLRVNSEVGFPHSEICGSKVAHTSPQLIAACHVLHRLCMPRQPPIALTSRLRIHTTIDSPACMTGADLSAVWFALPSGGRLDGKRDDTAQARRLSASLS